MAIDRVEIAGYPVWRYGDGEVAVRFVGRGPAGERQTVLAAIERALPVAWVRQTHSATVLEAVRGCSGEGDALVTASPGLALAVGTADCVPVAVGGEGALALIHAGWRGLTAGVVAAAVARLGRPPTSLAAWIGPAIGPCCYEVGWDVARQVAATTTGSILREDPDRGRPHLDLQAGVAAQLAVAGVGVADAVGSCTRCSPELWSYRRDGRHAGRNLAFAWLAG